MKNSYGLIATAIRAFANRIGQGFNVVTFCIMAISLLLVAPSLMATGVLKGKVLDKETNEGLPGANVVIKGTSIGAATDLNGAFSISNAPSGPQTVVVSYIGYISSTVVVNIPEGGTVNQDFSLGATMVKGEVVVITAQAQGQMQAINQQLASNKIVNVVSEAKIQELPDFNAAQAIGRLPGVSTLQSSGEANKIVVRGLAPQYNEVAIGGITLASTGSAQIGATSLGITSSAPTDDRSVDLTMITPYMIKSIEVYKSLTPDMEANAIGGYVNMELREAPTGFHGDALWQSGYTQKTNNYGNYRAVAAGSDRFFDDQLGVYVLANAEQYDRSADNMSASYATANATPEPNGFRPVWVNNVTLNRHLETRQRYGGNIILDYRLPFGSIKSVNSANRLNSNYNDYNTIIDYYAGNTNKEMDFSYREGKGTTDVAQNSLDFSSDFGFISADLKAANSYSRNYLPYSPYYIFQQNFATKGWSTAITDATPEELTHLVTYGPDSTTLLQSLNLFSSDYHENDQAYKADFKVPFSPGTSLSGFFKFGGEYRYNHITNDQSTPYITIRGTGGIATVVQNSIAAAFPGLRYNGGTSGGYLEGTNFTSTDTKLLSSFLNNKFGYMYWVPTPGILNGVVNYIHDNAAAFAPLQSDPTSGGWYDGPYQELPNDYKYVERYYGTYAMTELDFGSDLLIVGGARYEETKSLYFAYNMEDERNPYAQKAFPVTAYPQNHYWLPQVQARYNITSWSDIRYSYTQTLARPDYSALSPHFVVSAAAGAVYSGNPTLKPAQAENHDVLLSFHNNELGLLSFGGFYKEIDHFTYSATYPLYNQKFFNAQGVTDLPFTLESFAPFLSSADQSPNNGTKVTTFINSPYAAFVRGIETDLQTRLWYLPAPMDGIVLGVNYSRISSHAVYPYFDTRQIGRTVQFVDSTRTDRLVYQPNDVLNAYIGYDYRGFSGRVSFTYQGNIVTTIGAYPENEGFSRSYNRFDISARQKLPWADGLQLYLDVNNLNAEPNISTQPSIGGFTSEQFYGLTGDLGIRYTL
ncbi:MAG TPA: TonB-dependent receptor [Bacteroidota bacterium]|nr:TonB-dependent receptor [Bacteroidota bacterium]